jgi:hypothetical protein
MTLAERQRGALATINGVTRPVRYRIILWRIAFFLIALVIMVFFGVGLIASTQKFDEYFLENYFAIAIAWSLVSSALLGWYIRLLGGTKGEASAGFLALMGIWLVVVQVSLSPLGTGC